MKRVLSLVLALALVLGSIPAGFAADTQTAGEVLKGYGVLQGDANGNLNETQTIDRATMYTILIKLLGKDAEAKAYTVPSTFSDDNTSWAANYIAFAEKEGLTKGVGNGLFSPEGKVTLQQMATIMLRALGYEADYNTAIADATAQGLLKTVVETENNGIVVKSDVYTSMLNTLNAPVKDSTTLLGNALKIAGFVPANAGPVAVSSVTATTAKTIKVVFGAAPADTTKVVFTVQRATTPVSMVATWNEAKTEATLTSAVTLPEGEYTVAVKNDTVDLGTSKVTYTQQKIAKIEITSAKLAISGAFVTPATATSQRGYATYKVTDQYGVDITGSYLANNVTFQSGVASAITKRAGVITITPNTNLISFANVVITGYDSSTGVSTSATLATSTALGTLSDISLKALTNVNNKVLTAGDTTSVWYATYEATDISGTLTTDYNLVKNGLILTGTPAVKLNSSSPYVQAEIVTDPADSNKAAIKVTVVDASVISMDLPVSITAMTYTGKTSTLQLTLKKAAAVNTFTVMAPAFDVAVGETKEIPFVAYDQDGKELKKYSELNTLVTFSPASNGTTAGLYLDQRIDGTAKLMLVANAVKGPMVLTAMTPTGKISSTTINIQDAATADTLKLDSSVVVSAMQTGATQRVDFYDAGGLSVTDQYGRSIDMVTGTSTYRVNVTTSDAAKVNATGFATAGANSITVTAVAAGTATVTFNLVNTAAADPTAVIDSKSLTFSTVANADITDYTIDTVSDAIYTSAATGVGAPTARDLGYEANPYIFGKTNGGAKVILAGSPITGAYVDNTTDFYVTQGGTYDSTEVVARKFTDAAKKESTTNLAVTFVGADGRVHTLNTPIKSTTVAPVTASMTVSAANYKTGVTKDGDTVTINLQTMAATTFQTGQYVTRVKNDDGASVTRAAAYIYAKDQYGSKTVPLAQIAKVAGTSTVSNYGFSVNANGMITVNAAGIADGQYADITAVSSNGLVKTMRIVFTNTGVTAAAAATASATAAAGDVATIVATYEALPLTTDAQIATAVADTSAATAVAALPAGADKTALQARVTAKLSRITLANDSKTAILAYEALPLTTDAQIATTVAADAATALAATTANNLLGAGADLATYKTDVATRITNMGTKVADTNTAKTAILAYEALAVVTVANIATANADAGTAALTANNAVTVDATYKAAGLNRIAVKQAAVNAAGLALAQAAAATAVTTTNTANVILAKTALETAAAADVIDNAVDNTAALAAAKLSVKNVLTFTVTGAAAAANLNATLTATSNFMASGTDYSVAAEGLFTKSIVDGDATWVAGTGVFTAVAVTGTQVVTITNTYWGVSDTVSMTFSAGPLMVIAAD